MDILLGGVSKNAGGGCQDHLPKSESDFLVNWCLQTIRHWWPSHLNSIAMAQESEMIWRWPGEFFSKWKQNTQYQNIISTCNVSNHPYLCIACWIIKLETVNSSAEFAFSKLIFIVFGANPWSTVGVLFSHDIKTIMIIVSRSYFSTEDA